MSTRREASATSLAPHAPKNSPLPPKVPVPKVSAGTLKPEPPSFLYSMENILMWEPPPYSASPEKRPGLFLTTDFTDNTDQGITLASVILSAAKDPRVRTPRPIGLDPSLHSGCRNTGSHLCNPCNPWLNHSC